MVFKQYVDDGQSSLQRLLSCCGTRNTNVFMVFIFFRQTSIICFVRFRLNLELSTCKNEGQYYGRISFFIMSISELLYLSYPTLREMLWFFQCVLIYVQVYLNDVWVQQNG